MKKHLLLFLLALFTAALPGLAETTKVTFDFTKVQEYTTLGLAPSTSTTSLSLGEIAKIDPISISVSKKDNNGVRWWAATNNGELRLYNGGQLTISTSKGEIKAVSPNKGSASKQSNGDWIINGPSSSNTAITTIEVTYETVDGGADEVTIAAPTFAINGTTVSGTANAKVGDELTMSADGYEILYTVDGENPTVNIDGTEENYKSAIILTEGKFTYKAIAIDEAMENASEVATLIVTVSADSQGGEDPNPGTTVSKDVTYDFTSKTYGQTVQESGTNYISSNAVMTEGDINLTVIGNTRLWKKTNGVVYRLQKSGGFKLSIEDGNILKVEIETDGTNYITPQGSSNTSKTWEGKASSVTFNNSANNTTDIKTIKVTYEKAAGGEEPPVTENPVDLTKFEYSAATASWDLSASDNAALPTLEIQPADANLTITYKSSNTDVATVATDGTVTPVGEGTTTITATFTGNDKYNKAEASYTLTVTKSNTGGETPEPGTSITDVIDNAFTGVGTASSYSNWTKSSTTSGATYVGNSAGSYSSVQLRSTNDAGIVTTVSGGTAAKIKLTWNNNTSANRTVDIYGSNTPYTATSDLYNNAAKKIQSISVGDEKEYTLSGNYKYIGIRSASSALYLDKIEITWEQGGEDAIATPEFSCVDNKVSISCATEGAEIYYTMDGQTPDKSATKYDGKAIEITATTTFKAIACLNDKESQVAEYKAYYIPAQPMKVVEAIALINDGFEGELTAKGIVNRTTNFNTSFGSITYYISDDGTTTNELQVYGGLNIGGAKFNAQSDIEAGATVTVKGNVKLYNGNPEFDTNNVLIEYIPPKHEVIPQGPSFMITFGNVEGSQDGSNSVSSESLLKSLVSGKEYVESATEITNAYQGLKGLKIGKYKEAGSITLNLSHLGQRKVTYIVANASTWKDSNAKLVINGQEIALESAELADYAIELNGDRLESITLASTNASDYRLYVQGLTIYYEEEPAASNLTLTHSGGDELVLNETEVTAKADNATYYIVRKYNLDGTYTEEPVEDVEATFTVDKMHRRFEVVAGNAMGETEPVPAFYNIGKEETTTTEGGAKHYELVTDPTAIQAGDKLAIAVKGSTNMLFMSTEHETNASKGFVPVESNVSSKNESDHTAIEELPATAMILEVEYDTYNGMKLKNDNGYLYVGDGEISYKQTIQTGTTFTASKLDNQTENYILLASSTYIIKCNNGYGYFRGYKSTSGSVLDTKIYKEVGGSTTTTTLVADNPVYTVTLNFLEEATARGEMRTLAVPTDHEITIKGGTDGVTTYETQLPEDKVLAGTFNITVGVDGETLTLGGHKDSATTDFHNYERKEGDEGCSEEHAPYVYVGQDASNSAQVVSGIKLVNIDDEDAVDLSTHPNVYHGFVREYTAPTISLSLDPFKEITLGLDSTSGTTTSVNNIAVDSQSGEDVYYNLQGVRVDARNMVPGVYIRVNGKTSTKVLVK